MLPPTWQVVQEYGALGSHLDATQLVCRAPLPPLQQGQLPGEMTFLWSERAQRKGMSPVILDAGPLAVEQPRFRYWGWDAYDISWCESPNAPAELMRRWHAHVLLLACSHASCR